MRDITGLRKYEPKLITNFRARDLTVIHLSTAWWKLNLFLESEPKAVMRSPNYFCGGNPAMS